MERLVILGGGESGTGAALLGKKLGYEVFLSDKGKLSDKYKEVLEREVLGAARVVRLIVSDIGTKKLKIEN